MVLVTLLKCLEKINQFVVANDCNPLLAHFLWLLVNSADSLAQTEKSSLNSLVEHFHYVGVSVVAPVDCHGNYLVQAGEYAQLAGCWHVLGALVGWLYCCEDLIQIEEGLPSLSIQNLMEKGDQ